MTALCRGSANSAMGQVGSTMGRGLHGPGPGRASQAGWHCGLRSRRRPGRLTAAPWPRGVRGGLARRAAGLPAAPLGPTRAGARCPPQAAACPRRPDPIVFRAAAAAILKLFSGLSEEGGAPAAIPASRLTSRDCSQSEEEERAARGAGSSTQEARGGSRSEFKRNPGDQGGGKPWAALSPGRRAEDDRAEPGLSAALVGRPFRVPGKPGSGRGGTGQTQTPAWHDSASPSSPPAAFVNSALISSKVAALFDVSCFSSTSFLTPSLVIGQNE